MTTRIRVLYAALVVTVLGTESPVAFGRKEGMARPLRDSAAAPAAAAERNASAAPGRHDIVLVLHTPKVAGYSMLNTLNSIHARWPDRFGELWEPPEALPPLWVPVHRPERGQCLNQRPQQQGAADPFDWVCACLEGVQFVSSEISRALGLAWARQVRRRCGRTVHVVGFFRAPVRAAVSTFVQLLDHDCLTGAQPVLSAACSRTDTTAGMLDDFLAGKLCSATINACTNKQSRYFLLGDSKGREDGGGGGGGGGGGAYAGECVSRARLDSALGSLASLGIVEAFEVSVCLMAHTLGLAAVFRARCGRGVRLRGGGATITKNGGTATTMPMKSRRSQHLTLAGFVRPHQVRNDEAEAGSGDLGVFLKNAAPRSAQLLALVRANATLLRRLRRAHAADEMLYGAAVVRFAEAVGRMSRETGLRFELPASLQWIAQGARDGGHDDSEEGGGGRGCRSPSLMSNSPGWEFAMPRESGEGEGEG